MLLHAEGLCEAVTLSFLRFTSVLCSNSDLQVDDASTLTHFKNLSLIALVALLFVSTFYIFDVPHITAILANGHTLV